MASYVELAHSVSFQHQEIADHSQDLTLIGIGRSAAVFKIKGEARVIKIFYPEFVHLSREESDVYEKLAGIPYYPACYESGDNYLVIDHIEGETIYNCLVKGIVITEEVVMEVDKALEAARERGLHPSDVHIRNIILTPDDEVRLIDVARFANDKEDRQWDDLKRAFYTLYQKPYFPKSLPAALIDAIGRWYVQGQLPFYRRTDDFVQTRD